jgi:hypothetical protein
MREAHQLDDQRTKSAPFETRRARLTIEARRATLIDARRLPLDDRRTTLEVRRATLDITCEARSPTRNAREAHATLEVKRRLGTGSNVERSILIYCLTLDSRHLTVDASRDAQQAAVTRDARDTCTKLDARTIKVRRSKLDTLDREALEARHSTRDARHSPHNA